MKTDSLVHVWGRTDNLTALLLAVVLLCVAEHVINTPYTLLTHFQEILTVLYFTFFTKNRDIWY